jgi:hypothetical protein
MRATLEALFTVVVCASSTAAGKPKTVNEAVQVLKTQWLQPKDRDWILRNTKEMVQARPSAFESCCSGRFIKKKRRGPVPLSANKRQNNRAPLPVKE